MGTFWEHQKTKKIEKNYVIYKSLSNHSQEEVKTILSLYPKLKIFMNIRLIRPRIVGEKKLT
jgi:hypothetical protein